MAPRFELVTKQSFTRDLKELPHRAAFQVLDDIEYLRERPQPSGDKIKKLTGYDRIFRLRSGDYRIVYSYKDPGQDSAGTVWLLGVDDRKDVYRRRGRFTSLGDQYRVPIGLGGEWLTEIDRFAHDRLLESSHDEVEVEGSEEESGYSTPVSELPRHPTTELLEHLGVERRWVPLLAACRTLEDLTRVSVPEDLRNLVWDALVEPDWDRVLQQPDYVVNAAEFRRMVQGESIPLLLKLDEYQQGYVKWPASSTGPSHLKGSPGTGKSVIALYRIKELLDQLSHEGRIDSRVLFVSYTNSLVAASQQKLVHLLGHDVRSVRAMTVDKLTYNITGGPWALDGNEPIEAVASARALLPPELSSAIAHISDEYLQNEIDAVIDGMEFTSLSEYLDFPRVLSDLNLTPTEKSAIWELSKRFGDVLDATGKTTFTRRCTAARRLLASMPCEQRKRRQLLFDGVVIDEAQDLTPAAIRLLVEACPVKNRLLLTTDPNQSIYGSGIAWRDISEDLNVRGGRTRTLSGNYRSTAQIAQASIQYLRPFLRPRDQVPVIRSHREGPSPLAIPSESTEQECAIVADYLKESSTALRCSMGACAVFAPTNEAARHVANQLRERNIPARHATRTDVDLSRPLVHVMTLHSAKGLEFPIVALAGFHMSLPYRVKPNRRPAEHLEEFRRAGRLVYVGMTRAMEALLLLVPNHLKPRDETDLAAVPEAAHLFRNLIEPNWLSMLPSDLSDWLNAGHGSPQRAAD